jgi:WD40 repeat protein
MKIKYRLIMFKNENLIKYTFSHYKFPNRLRLTQIQNNLLLDVLFRLDSTIEHKFSITKQEELCCIASLPDGNFVSGTKEGIITLWSDDYKFIKSWSHEGGRGMFGMCIIVMLNGNLVAGALNGLKIWSYKDNYRCIYSLTDHWLISCLLFLPNGDLVAGSFFSEIRVWDSHNEFKHVKELIKTIRHSVNSLILLDEKRFASASSDGKIRVWDYSNGYKRIKTFDYGSKGVIHTLLLLKNGNVASGVDDGSIDILDMEGYDYVETITGHRKKVTDIISSDGCIISGSNDGFVRMWDGEEFRFIKEFKTKCGDFCSVRMLQNGDIAICCNLFGIIEVWGV